jgi:hypothetical protein
VPTNIIKKPSTSGSSSGTNTTTQDHICPKNEIWNGRTCVPEVFNTKPNTINPNIFKNLVVPNGPVIR